MDEAEYGEKFVEYEEWDWPGIALVCESLPLSSSRKSAYISSTMRLMPGISISGAFTSVEDCWSGCMVGALRTKIET